MSLRTRVAVLVLSAAGVTTIANWEGFRDKAYLPTKNDRPTVGFGSTYNSDGTPVKMGQTITREAATKLLTTKANDVYAVAVKKCAPYELFQYEFDAYVDFTYNLGAGVFCNSRIPKYIAEQNYEAACKEMLKYNKQCTKLPNGTKSCIVLPGLDKRRKDNYEKCMGAQEPKENK